MKKIVLFALAAVILAACTPKDNVSVAPSAKKFYASIEQSTRTYTEGGKVCWINEESFTDAVSIFNQGSTNVKYLFDGETGATQGELVPAEDSAEPEGKYDYIYAVYPYADYVELQAEGLLYAYLAPNQSYSGDTFSIYGGNPMVAVSETESLQFKNLAGFLKLRLYGDDSTAISSVVVSSNKGEYIAGDILVSIAPGEDPEMEVYDGAGYANKSASVSFTDSYVFLDPSEPLDVWVSLVPGTLSEGITVTVTGVNGASFEYSSSNPLTIKRGVCTATAPLEVKFSEMNYLGKGTITDGNMYPLFGLDDATYDCDVYESVDNPGIYYIGGYQLAMISYLYEESEETMAEYEGYYWKDSRFAVDARNTKAVYIPEAEYGIYMGDTYGWVGIESEAVGTLVAGEITFPKKKVYVWLYNDGGYYGNKNGTFKITIPTAAPLSAPGAEPAPGKAPRVEKVRRDIKDASLSR